MTTTTSTSFRLKVEPTAKRIRAYVGGQLLVDTTRALLVWESPYYPHYYLPKADVNAGLLVESDSSAHSPSRGDAVHHSIRLGDEVLPDAAWEYPDSPMEAIRDHVRVEWSAADRWFEEDEEVFVHPRSPFVRVDCLPSSRHVQVAVDGVTVADTRRPTLLFETGLPTRYYLPPTDVRLDLLEPTGSSTGCPYKGTASYWTLTVGDRRYDDLVWGYPTPLPECIRIAGLLCFPNDRVDLIVDGEPVA